MSEATIRVLREAQATNPEIQADRKAISDHNLIYERICTKSETEQ